MGQWLLATRTNQHRESSLVKLHLISDSTGETLRSFSRASLAHIDLPTAHSEKVWSLVRSQAKLEQVFDAIKNDPGIVLYTLADKALSDKIEQFCQANKLPHYGLLERSIEFFAAATGYAVSRKIGSHHYHHNEESLSRLAAMEFALTHDDGQSPQGYQNADVVIVGVSRTSKTPTCIYLANRGIRAANYPLVQGRPLPHELLNMNNVLVVGLTLSARALADMRRTRLDQLGEEQTHAYVDHENIRQEISEARRIYSEQGWITIDVTRRSIEETASIIIQKLETYQNPKETES